MIWMTVFTSLLLPSCTSGEDPAPPKPDTLPPPAPDAPIAIPPPLPSTVKPGDPEPPITANNCEDPMTPPEVKPGSCITGRLQCGQTTISTTKGGGDWFDTRFYERSYCTPATTRHDDGFERAFVLSMPAGDNHAAFFLDTPCADLDMAVMRIMDPSVCPDTSSVNEPCDMWPKPGTSREVVELSSQGETHWLVVVEGKTAVEAPFSLTVTCREGL